MNSPIEELLRNDGIAEAIFIHLPNTFRFTAVVSPQFHEIYATVHNDANTSYENAVATVEMARISMFEGGSAIALCETAALFGRLAVLQDLFDKGLIEDWGEAGIPTLAAANGHLEVIQWAWSNGCPKRAEVCQKAAENGNLELLQWARGNDCPWDGFTCSDAARKGHLGVLQWARGNNCPWDAETCSSAAINGHLEVLQWARGNDCPWDAFTCRNAAWKGHLEVLQWARRNDCPWDAFTCTNAAWKGHLEVLQWARRNGCSWNREICLSVAMENGHHHVCDWIRGEDVA